MVFYTERNKLGNIARFGYETLFYRNLCNATQFQNCLCKIACAFYIK